MLSYVNSFCARHCTGGFGLGFSVVKSAVEAGLHGSTGNFAWGGAASTIFWCDPVEDISVVFFTQVMGMQPRNMLRAKLGSMVYSSIADRRLSATEVAVASARARVDGSGVVFCATSIARATLFSREPLSASL